MLLSKSRAAALFQIILGLGSHLYYLCFRDIIAGFSPCEILFHASQNFTYWEKSFNFPPAFSSIANGDNVVFPNS